MAGEINGTPVVISNVSGVIVGQMEMTLTFNGGGHAQIEFHLLSYSEMNICQYLTEST